MEDYERGWMIFSLNNFTLLVIPEYISFQVNKTQMQTVNQLKIFTSRM